MTDQIHTPTAIIRGTVRVNSSLDHGTGEIEICTVPVKIENDAIKSFRVKMARGSGKGPQLYALGVVPGIWAVTAKFGQFKSNELPPVTVEAGQQIEVDLFIG